MIRCKVWVYLAHAPSPQKASHGLLDRALRCWAAERGTTADLTVVRPQYQKPYLKGLAQVDVSVSRSGEYWACAISEQKVGLDLQQKTFAGTERIARRFFHPREQAYLAARPEDFFLVWTAKESYVKLTGEGVTDHFGAFSVADEGGMKTQLEGKSFRFLDGPEGYTLCLCAEDPSELTLAVLE